MMEFTCDGMVRYGFGFYNPNHAAALICALMPFLWGWKRLPQLGWALFLLLAIALAFTYSRTGIMVVFFELAAWFLLSERRNWNWRRNWKWIASTTAGVLVIAASVGVFSRFTLDRSLLNRPEIWLAGGKLYAANPMGVGSRYSGILASTFLLDGIECRTLVNSHLTLLVEWGMIAGFLWGCGIIYALIRGIGKVRSWCAFAGMVISASAASVFDWGILLDFHEYGELPFSNFLLSWLTLLLFVGLGGYLAWGKIRRHDLVVAAGSCMVILLLPFMLYSGTLPKVRNGMVVKEGGAEPLVLYSAPWTLRSVLPFMKDGYRVPLQAGRLPERSSLNTETNVAEVWFFGNAAEYVRDYPDADYIFVSPPEFFPCPERTKKIYLKYFAEDRNFENCDVEYY